MTVENSVLAALGVDLVAARQELASAINDREWLIDEWRHLWPAAPDEITTDRAAYDSAEVDLGGTRIVRADGHTRGLRALEWLGELASRDPERDYNGRLIKSATRVAYNRRAKKEAEHALELGRAYYAERERIREASGIKDATKRVDDARAAVQQIVRSIAEQPISHMADLTVKLDAHAASIEAQITYSALTMLCPEAGVRDLLVAEARQFLKGGAA